MKSTYTLKLLLVVLISMSFFACESEYSRTVKKELKSGAVHEDLIFGMKMGQTQKDFFDRCWNLNKQQLVSQGPGNKFAKHVMVLDSTENNPEKVQMLFYGIFDDKKIMRGMHMIMNYEAWAPWNKKYQSDVLIKKLKEKYMNEYGGNPFIEVNIEDKITAYAKIDGNRQILMYPNDPKDVTVKIKDLRHSILPKDI